MASEQARRENSTGEREVDVEKDSDPKLVIRFESLADKVKNEKERDEETEEETEKHDLHGRSGNIVGDKDAEAREGSEDYNVGKIEINIREENCAGKAKGGGANVTSKEGSREETGGAEMRRNEEVNERKEQPSLEEISNLRAKAQENSLETLRTAEERYGKAKESVSQGLDAASEYAKEKASQAMDTVSETGRAATEYATEKGAQAKDTVVNTARAAAEYASEKGSQAKDTVVEKGRVVKDTAAEKAAQAKDTAAEKGAQAEEVVLEKSETVKDTATEKGAQAKDTVSSTAKTAASYTASTAEKARDYALQKAVEAKDVVVYAGETTVHDVGEKTAVAKEVTLETGKGAVDYAGKAAVELKDKATVAGWTAGHYTCDKTVEGTKAAARAVKGAAEYAGHKAGDIASKPLSAAKDAAVTAGESAKEYTARKKEEAERELEARRSAGQQGDNTKGEWQVEERKTEEVVEPEAKPSDNVIKETFQGNQEQGSDGGGGRGAVLGAIGETIVEIAQQTRELAIGQGNIGKQEGIVSETCPTAYGKQEKQKQEGSESQAK